MPIKDFFSWFVLAVYAVIQILFIRKHTPIVVTKDIKKMIGQAFMIAGDSWFMWIVIGGGCLYSVRLPDGPRIYELAVFILITLIPPICFGLFLLRAVHKHYRTI